MQFKEQLKQAVQNPTLKQKEAYGRFFHTLAAAGIIGCVSVLFTESQVTWYGAWRIIGLFASAVACFAAGAMLSKGE